MKIISQLPLLFLVFTLSCEKEAENYPFHLNASSPMRSEFDGLKIVAKPQKRIYSSDEAPVIEVIFTNVSSKPIALLNHFAYCAEGPTLTINRFSPSNSTRFQMMVFEKSLPFSQASPKWLILKPKESYSFKSSLAEKLPTGHHRLQVFYSVGGPAAKMITECRAIADCPKDFWHGSIATDIITIDIQ